MISVSTNGATDGPTGGDRISDGKKEDWVRCGEKGFLSVPFRAALTARHTSKSPGEEYAGGAHTDTQAQRQRPLVTESVPDSSSKGLGRGGRGTQASSTTSRSPPTRNLFY